MKSRWADSPGKRGGGAKEDRRDIPPTKKPADSAGSRTPTKKPSASLAKAEEDEKDTEHIRLIEALAGSNLLVILVSQHCKSSRYVYTLTQWSHRVVSD